MFIAKSLKHKPIDVELKDENAQSIGVEITNLKQKLQVCSVYRAPGQPLVRKEWERYVQDIKKLGSPILIGDFNAKNVAWNCDISDDAGIKLLDIMERHQMDVINFNTKTYINLRNNSFSNLDLIFSDSKITDMIEHLQEEEPMGSDHFPIRIDINMERNIYRKKTNKISSKRTNWEAYREEMDTAYNSLLEPDTPILKKYKNFTEKMIEAITPQPEEK
ncbi:uncharacterized protein LOC128896486 [Hylaeus anthracinus]|uniref:uncharacterized protein LOC128896486 n=1 Tax=Hylaeus anthracinus TaxID=313031 RepID=UPI0023B9992C|nr:uncharacterized protein LOC128896486 [Hylaeus anthracinus]